jgi:hypothetical protein
MGHAANLVMRYGPPGKFGYALWATRQTLLCAMMRYEAVQKKSVMISALSAIAAQDLDMHYGPQRSIMFCIMGKRAGFC